MTKYFGWVISTYFISLLLLQFILLYYIKTALKSGFISVGPKIKLRHQRLFILLDQLLWIASSEYLSSKSCLNVSDLREGARFPLHFAQMKICHPDSCAKTDQILKLNKILRIKPLPSSTLWLTCISKNMVWNRALFSSSE